MDAKELLPCPFCGASARTVLDDLCGDGPGYYRVWCNGRENHGLDALFDDEQGAIDTWNMRPALSAQAAEVERLRTALIEIADSYKRVAVGMSVNTIITSTHEKCAVIARDALSPPTAPEPTP